MHLAFERALQTSLRISSFVFKAVPYLPPYFHHQWPRERYALRRLFKRHPEPDCELRIEFGSQLRRDRYACCADLISLPVSHLKSA